MQAQRFFVEHCIKESKSILGMHQLSALHCLLIYFPQSLQEKGMFVTGYFPGYISCIQFTYIQIQIKIYLHPIINN